MSCFIEFLQFILCCYVKEESEDEYQHRNRRHVTYPYSPQTLSTPFIKQSNPYTDCNPHIQNSSDLSKSFQNLTETRTKTSIPTKLPKKENYACVKPSVVPNSADQFKNPVNSVCESASKFSQHGSSSSSKAHPYIDSNLHIKNCTNLVESFQNLAETKTKISIPAKLTKKASDSCVKPSLVPNSTAQFENPVNSVYESASKFSQYDSSSSSKPRRTSSKPTIMSIGPSGSRSKHEKNNYVFVREATSPTYTIPEDLKKLFETDVVPMILKKSVTPSTYKKYFETLLYAEDFYFQKWDGFVMKNVTLELHKAAVYNRRGNHNVNEECDDKVFVAFKMNSIPDRRPFLLSRDFVSVHPSGKDTAPFQGVIYRVVKSNLVLVEFEEDFHRQHNLVCKYDVKFSFNRVCLKRAHQAISAISSNPLLQNYIFPNTVPKNNTICAGPYIIEGPLSICNKTTRSSTTRGTEHETILSRSGDVIRCRAINIYNNYPSCHILICAPTNKTCDVITKNLQEEIPDIFRANAAFREVDGVPLEIFPSCRHNKELFLCPSLKELKEFSVVVSTFMSAFRLHDKGITAGHFTHIFLIDASSTTEPEAMVALANLANDDTKVIVSGTSGNRSSWVRSDIARRNGLMVSYFERIRKSKFYHSHDRNVISLIGPLENWRSE